MKNKLFNFVDYAAYINLRNRIDKKDILELHFSELGILQYVNRLDAPEPLDFFKMVIPGFNAPTFDQKLVTSEVKAHCCWIGHYRIIKEAKRLGAKNALVFEDDAEFIKSPYYSPDNLINDCETFSKDWPPLAADEYIDRIFRNKYIVYPMAVIQRKMNSDIVEGKREWYEWEKSYEKIMNRMNILF